MTHARRLYAHRGASAERPENTLPAFQRAIEIGVDCLELDVHVTRDGKLVVSHDDTAFRMAGVAAKWAELDFVDARGLDVGWGFVAADGTRPFSGQQICVPTLDEVLELGLPLNIDLKHDPRTVELAIETIRSHGAEERVTLAAFQMRTTIAVHRRKYVGPVALSQTEVATLLALPALAWRALPYTGTAAQVPVNAGPARFDRTAFIAKCHSLGLRVDFWTIDAPDEAARLLALGADGIMTNDPAALRSLFSR